jgi:hypothetical protein
MVASRVLSVAASRLVYCWAAQAASVWLPTLLASYS